MTTIPLVDLDRWSNGSPTEREELAVEVDRHLQRLGFLVVVNHGIAPTVMANCRSEALRFFHSPPAAKAPLALGHNAQPDWYRGWIGQGLESNAATYGIETPPDLKESFTFGPVDVPDEGLRAKAPRWFAPNVWPDGDGAFQAAAERWWRSARSLADDLLDLFDAALGLPPAHLRRLCAATTAASTINWYGPRGTSTPEPDQFRAGPHTDFGTLTILDRQPGLGGLQVLDEDGVWIDAPHVDGGLLVNTGDMLRQWTNDRWESNQHRVLPPPAEDPDEELLSLIFFHEPDYDVMIDAFPSCVSDDRPARYAPIRADEYLAEKMDALSV